MCELCVNLLANLKIIKLWNVYFAEREEYLGISPHLKPIFL